MAFLSINPEFAAHLEQQGFRTFHDFFFYTGGQVIGGHPSRNVSQVDLGELRGFLKRQHWLPWKDPLASWWAGFGFVSKSRREWNVLHALRERGIACPQPVAVGEHEGRAFLLVRELPQMADLKSYLDNLSQANDAERSRLARTLGRTLAHFHASGFSHPDLYAKHVFVHEADQSIQFIDFQRTRFRKWVTWRQRWRDLAALDASLSETLASPRERLLCLAAYLKFISFSDQRRLLRRSLWAIARRSARLLQRRKIKAMRQAAALPTSQIEYFRVVIDGGEPAAEGTPALEPSTHTQGRW